MCPRHSCLLYTSDAADEEDNAQSFVAPINDDGAQVLEIGQGGYAVGGGLSSGQFVDMEGGVKSEQDLIIRYRQMSLIPEVDMAIDDLPLFLGAISLFEHPQLFFPDDKKVVIYDEGTKGKTTYYYSDPDIIGRVPEFNPDLPDKEIEFDLPQACLLYTSPSPRDRG